MTPTDGLDERAWRVMRGVLVLIPPLVGLCLPWTAVAQSPPIQGPCWQIVDLTGREEVPPNDSEAIGRANICVLPERNELEFFITHNLERETASEIRGPASRGSNGPIKQRLPLGKTKHGFWNYSDADEAEILQGLIYIEIHTRSCPCGGIRGQVDNFHLGAKPPVRPALDLRGLVFIGVGILVLGLVSFRVLRLLRIPSSNASFQPVGDDVSTGLREWLRSEISGGPKQGYELGRFGFTVSAGTIGAITGIEKLNDSSKIDFAMAASLLLLFVSIVVAVAIACPRETRISGSTDLLAEYHKQVRRAIGSVWMWFVLWLLGAVLGGYAVRS